MSMGVIHNVRMSGLWEAIRAFQQEGMDSADSSAASCKERPEENPFAQCLIATTSSNVANTAAQKMELTDPLRFMPQGAEIELTTEQPEEGDAFGPEHFRRSRVAWSEGADAPPSSAKAMESSSAPPATVARRLPPPAAAKPEGMRHPDRPVSPMGIAAKDAPSGDRSDALQVASGKQEAAHTVAEKGEFLAVQEGSAVSGMVGESPRSDNQSMLLNTVLAEQQADRGPLTHLDTGSVAGKSLSVMLSEAKHLNSPRNSEILPWPACPARGRRFAQNDTRVSGHTSRTAPLGIENTFTADGGLAHHIAFSSEAITQTAYPGSKPRSSAATAMKEPRKIFDRSPETSATIALLDDNGSWGNSVLPGLRSASGHAVYSHPRANAQEFQSAANSIAKEPRHTASEEMMEQDFRPINSAVDGVHVGVATGAHYTVNALRTSSYSGRLEDAMPDRTAKKASQLLLIRQAAELNKASLDSLPSLMTKGRALVEVSQLGSVDAGHIASWLVKKAQIAVQSGRLEVELQLEPRSLGRMKVRLEIVADVLTAHMEVQSQAAKEIVERQLPALQQRLLEKGVRAEKIEIVLVPQLQRHESQPAEIRSHWPYTDMEQHRQPPQPRQQRGRPQRFGQNRFLDFMA